jgi:hypothetical protein
MVLRIDVLAVRLRLGRGKIKKGVGEGNERKTGVFWLKCSSVFGQKVQ